MSEICGLWMAEQSLCEFGRSADGFDSFEFF